MTTKKCSDKCPKSPDKNHCWHNIASVQAWVPSGTKQVNEFCCWCGKNRSYEVELKISYILRNLFPGEYKYNGDGRLKFYIANHRPDFPNINGKKKIIEGRK